jgi:hypothetical protein
MASTYSNLKIELMGTGDQSGTWGTTTNTNLGTAIEEAITGTADVSFSSADVTLTLTNTNTAQTARNLRLNLTGTVGAAQNLIVPNIEKQYIINNTLGYDITVKNSTGTGVAVPAGKSMIVFNTGSNVVDVVSALGSGTVLPVANGGTGASTASITSFNNITGYTASGATGTTSTNVVFSASPTLTGTPLAPTASPGTNTTQVATTAFVGAAVTAATGSLGTMSTQNANAVAITGGTITGITDLAVADGGTGASTLSANAVLLGNGTSALQTVAPSTSGNVLTSNGTTWTSAALNFDKSFTANGWQKIPGGLILQWGESSFINSDSSVSVTFPIAFTTSCFQVIVSGTAGTSGAGEVALASIDLTTTTVTIINDGGKGSTARWFAIGY